MTLEKVLIILLGLMSVALVIFIVLLFKQKIKLKKMKTMVLEGEIMVTIFHSLGSNYKKLLTVEIINLTTEAFIESFRDIIIMYYENVIRKVGFTDLTKFIYELENLVPSFHKKRLIMEIFSSAASKIDTLYWAKILMDGIINPPLYFAPNYQAYNDRAGRLEDFIIATISSSQRLILLEDDFKNEMSKNSNRMELADVKKAGELLDKMCETLKKKN